MAAHAFPHPTAAMVVADGSQGSSFVDALSAGPLGALESPGVLSGPSQLPIPTAHYLEGVSPSSLWVLGRPAAIDTSVLQTLDRMAGSRKLVHPQPILGAGQGATQG